jgi:hypothetical protein
MLPGWGLSFPGKWLGPRYTAVPDSIAARKTNPAASFTERRVARPSNTQFFTFVI